ncbi:hypothetical protein ACIRU8_39215 [Streptomyces sp. NPDC101175]
MTVPPADCEPNWRDNQAELDRLCEIGAALLHRDVQVRDMTTIDPPEEYL